MEEFGKTCKDLKAAIRSAIWGVCVYLDRWSLDERPHFIKGMMLKPSLNKGKGYLRVSLSDGHRNYKHYEVHRLVALHFVPGYKEGLVVNHINEIKTDNRAENLEWCTYQYNLNYSDVEHGSASLSINMTLMEIYQEFNEEEKERL